MSCRAAITYSETLDVSSDCILRLYDANEWSSAKKPDALHAALINSHSLVTAWHEEELVGLGNAISDGYLVVYYPHLSVLPTYQHQGIGLEIFNRLKAKYSGFHQHVVLADRNAVGFFERCGFRRAGATQPLWIYDGDDHSA